MPLRYAGNWRRRPAASAGRAVAAAAITGMLGLLSIRLIRLLATSVGPTRARPPGQAAAANTSPPGAPRINPERKPSESASEPEDARTRSPWYWLRAVVLGLGCAVASVLFYHWLNDTYPSATVTASTSNFSALPQLELTSGRGAAVQWSVTGGYIRTLVIQGPARGWADVDLGVPQSLCPRIAGEFGTTCHHGRLSLSPPAQFTWSTPIQVLTPAANSGATSLDMQTVAPRGGVPGVIVTAQAKSTPAICFFAVNPATLTVTDGGSSHSFVTSGPVGCGQGSTAVVGSTGRGQPPAFDFAQISSLTLTAHGPDGTLQGLDGQVAVNPGRTVFLSGAAGVAMRSRSAVPLVTTLGLGLVSGGPGLKTESHGTTSVITSSGQLVPSFWARNTTLLVPFLGLFITTFVGGPIGLMVGGIMDGLKRPWSWPFRRRRRRETRMEADRAPS